MTSRILPKHLSLIAIAGCSVLAGRTVAQVQPQIRPTVQKSPNTYEDREIQVKIPAGWRTLPSPQTSRRDAVDAPGRLSLEKNGYKLSLGYHVGHASGIIGGRFIEAFDLNWPGLDDPWTCSAYLTEYPQPASRKLIFINLVVDTGDPRVRENCAIRKNLGTWTEKEGVKQYLGEKRWFGGYFRPTEGGYFFGGNNDDCQFKAYTLTSEAKAPDELPDAGNPVLQVPDLQGIIQEAIDIVNSIHYKRCPPF
jgi:hypothetical protein